MLDTNGTATSTVIKLLKFMQVFCLLCIQHDFLRTCSGAATVDEQQVILRCKDNERKALLTLKKGLATPDINPSGNPTNLSTWGNVTSNMECCKWDGVHCSNMDGHVVGLELFGLTGEISPALLELHHLNMLDLSYIDFGRSKIPEFIGSLHKLEHLRLWDCHFDGDVPYQLGNLTKLRYLDLSYNEHLTSKDLSWLSNLTLLNMLDLVSNQLGGSLSWLSSLSTLLSYVFLSYNQFEGPIPDLKPLSSLIALDLDHNYLTGQLPTTIGQLSSLEALDVSQNSLEGTISDAHFSFLHNLTRLDLSFNSLDLNFTPHWIPPFQLHSMRLANCNMGPHFPSWLQTQANLAYLDLSSTGISEEVPSWFWNHFVQFRLINLSLNSMTGMILDFLPIADEIGEVALDISFNNFSGPLPLFNPYFYIINLSHNMFSGTIQSISTVPYVSLLLLDLSNNQLSGEISNCFENMTDLIVLNLAENQFDGTVPPSLGSLVYLQTLILRNNAFTGELPSALRGCELLELIDFGGNALTGNVPTWMGSLTNLVYLILGQNNFYGNIPPEICRLSKIQVLDLSQNSISGIIPQCFQNFTSLVQNNGSADVASVWLTFNQPGIVFHSSSYVNNALVRWKRQSSEYKNTLGFLKLIDLSNNNLVGNIPLEISRLAGLASLNLSQNHLSGNIISEIGSMKRLESLDLSRNKLSGKIPKSTQLQSFNASAYAGNNLCGEPLPNCMGDDPRPKSFAHNPENHGAVEDKNDGGFNLIQYLVKEYFVSAILGYNVGFWVVVGPLLIMKKCLFLDLSKIGVWLNVMITLSWTRLIRYMKSRTYKFWS